MGLRGRTDAAFIRHMNMRCEREQPGDQAEESPGAYASLQLDGTVHDINLY
jgi:hypothetical protein